MDYIPAGTTDVSLVFALTTGGLTISAIKVSAVRYTEGDGTSFAVIGPTALTALAAITTAHDDNYGKYLDTETSSGAYFLLRVDVPDTYFATGKDRCVVSVYDDAGAEIAHRIFRLTPVPVNLVQILGTALTETAGYLAAGFKKFFNVATPVMTAESVNQTGDSFTRIGAAGASLTDLGGMSTGMKAEVNAECDTALTDAALATAAELAKVPKSDAAVTWNATALASINAEVDTALTGYDAPTNTEMVAAFTEIKGATWEAGTDTLEHIRDKETDIEGKIDTADTVVDAIKVKTDQLTFTEAGNVDANIQYVNDIEVTGDGETGTEWGPV